MLLVFSIFSNKENTYRNKYGILTFECGLVKTKPIDTCIL